MLQVCPDCRTAYHWEFPRFRCTCGRYDPSLAALAEALTQERAPVVRTFSDGTPPARAQDSATRQAERTERGRPFLAPRDNGPTSGKSRQPKPQDRTDLDEEIEDLPWQRRSRNVRRGNPKGRSEKGN